MYKYLKWGICTVILAISLSACGGRSEKIFLLQHYMMEQ